MRPAIQPTLYEQLERLREGLKGEILSPSTEGKDREIKMPIYSHCGVAYAWLVDVKRHTLEAFALHQGQWETLAEVEGDEAAAIPPFDSMRLELGALWGQS